jgi:hypothetical protein
VFEKDGDQLQMYQPQVDSWKEYSVIRWRSALALTLAGTKETHYGVLGVQADSIVDHDARMVLMSNLDVDIRFAGVPEAKENELRRVARECLPKREHLAVALDHVLAYMHTEEKVPAVEVALNPPPIFYSNAPAILVVYLGQPRFEPIKATRLMFAVNTNWLVLMDTTTSRYYLLDDGSWLTSSDPLKGTWTGATTLPDDFSRMPADKAWDDVRNNVPGQPIADSHRVLTSSQPAELIVTKGAPEFTPISGTRLMYVSNCETPLFLDLIDGNNYCLLSGRWFRAKELDGPWSAASSNLPPEFVKIPPESAMGNVLASVPNTQEAQDAILLASIPHKATVRLSDAALNVTYDGPPRFAPVQSTAMTYAVNTAYQVVSANGQYYCCHQGVWFVAPAPTGSWTVCSSVPSVIYTIPPSCPLYNATYVRVYSSTPTTVVVGYTGGYSGEYVAATGALMFGTGYTTIAANASWYGCSPCYYSYGCAASYSYAYGGYYRAGNSCYGPYGGAGWGSSYNAATGTYARAGVAYGPSSARWGAQAYNPFTNSYAQHTGGTNGYQSWGNTAVSHDGQWAQAGHVSSAAGTAGVIQTSSGQAAAGVHTAGGSTVAETNSGNVYAGHDGNVYKKSGDQWQQYQGNGNWANASWKQSTEANKPSEPNKPSEANEGPTAQRQWNEQETQTRMNQDSWARERGNSNASATAGARRGGFQGRR